MDNEEFIRWEIEVDAEWTDGQIQAAISGDRIKGEKLEILKHVQEQRTITNAEKKEAEERDFKERAQITAEEGNIIAVEANKIAKDARAISYGALAVAIGAILVSFFACSN